ncbi:MAG: FAD-dependent monooxygenase [Pseudomonadota bacterium]
MQYYLNGFRPGDPADHRDPPENSQPLRDLPEIVDVLIVGCGPAGLMLAAQLAKFQDISTRIIEQKPGPLLLGQADGISGRSLEIFQAFGFSERVLKEAYFLEAITFWQHDPDHPDRIVRTTKKPDGRGVFSEFPHVVLNQARVHDFLLEVMRKSPSQLEPDYCRRLRGIEIGDVSAAGDDRRSFPVKVDIERLDPEHEGQTERIRARYVVGCDGARSAVRQSLSLPLRGDSANKAWGVMDLLVVTDFPDIRIKSIIQSGSEGNLLIIPREGGHLVRLYVEMDQLKESERVASRNITCEQLIEAAQRILRPYILEVKEVAWWSVYEIGQRLCDTFDNRAQRDAGAGPTAFIVGDACHTHSPKAGQGMNVSMHDSFNLGWKLATVIRGQSSPALLNTYSEERQAVAGELISFDRELATMFSVPVEDAAGDGDAERRETDLQKYMVRHDGYVSGTLSRYGPSTIVAESVHQHLATGFEVGKRFHSSPVIRLVDARPIQLGHVLEADGRWRIVAFANSGDPTRPTSVIAALAHYLESAPESPIKRYTPTDADVDSVIEFLAVFQQGYRDLEVESLPPLLRPEKGVYGLRDYEKSFSADLDKGGEIFDERGIDRDRGCVLIVRPDQHVAHVLPLDGFAEISAFFDGFMVSQN